MSEFDIALRVRAVDSSDVRDLANGVQEAIRRAQANGQHAAVAVVQGPSITPPDDTLVRLLVEADSELSHMLHRLTWASNPSSVSRLIGRLRNTYEPWLRKADEFARGNGR